jgi:hypothetical protein
MQIHHLATLLQIEDETKPEIEVLDFRRCLSASAATCQNEFWRFVVSTWDSESGTHPSGLGLVSIRFNFWH